MKFLGALRIISLLTTVMSLFCGIAYGATSNCGPIRRIENLHVQDPQIVSVNGSVRGQNVDEELDAFFKSSVKTQKLFFIDQSKVGLIFNPKGEALRVGFMTVGDGVVIISDKSLPSDVISRIAAKIPSGYTYSTLSFGSINGKSTFVVLGFE